MSSHPPKSNHRSIRTTMAHAGRHPDEQFGFVNTPMSIQADGSHEYNSDWFRDVYVKYGKIPLRRWAEPEDIAGPAYFLCSDDGAYVTGQVLLVDGGTSATF